LNSPALQDSLTQLIILGCATDNVRASTVTFEMHSYICQMKSNKGISSVGN